MSFATFTSLLDRRSKRISISFWLFDKSDLNISFMITKGDCDGLGVIVISLSFSLSLLTSLENNSSQIYTL